MINGGSQEAAEVFGRTLLELVSRDSNTVVLDADTASVTRADLVAEARADRFLMMGCAEQNMVGVAAGLATLGFIPWVVGFASSLTERDLEQIRLVVAQPGLPVKFAAHCGGSCVGGPVRATASVTDLALIRALPGMVIIVPADGVETRKALLAAHECPGPVYLRLVAGSLPDVFGEDHAFEIGKAFTIREGDDVAIISTGAQTLQALRAAEILDTIGVSSLILHMPTLKPLDQGAIIGAARRTGAVITAEDHSILGGLGSAVAEILGENQPTRMRRVGVADTVGDSTLDDPGLATGGVSAAQVAEAARLLLRK